jgi:Icc-related predicted phosphoesterase
MSKIKNKIVLMHIPPIVTDDPNIPEEYTAIQLEKYFKPLFNEIGVDIVISGHTHRHILVEKGERDNNYPIITNDNEDVMLVRSDKDGIGIKIIGLKDNVVLDRVFK